MSAPIRENVIKVLNSQPIDMPEMEDVQALYRDLYPVASAGCDPAGSWRESSGDERAMRLEEGFTLVDPGDLLPAPGDLAARATAVYEILAKHSDSDESGEEARVAADEEIMTELAGLYLSEGEETLRQRIDKMATVNTERVMFVVFNALKGVFTAAAGRLADINTEIWERGTCPVCAGLPAVAYLEGEGGQRYLVCHRCESRWRFMRIRCPYCDNRNHEELGYFTVEGKGERARVEFCRKCNGYIKNWDIREEEGVVPEASDLLTPALDLAAEKEGFARGAPNIFGIWIGFDDEE